MHTTTSHNPQACRGVPQDRSAGPQHTTEKRKRNAIPHSKQVPNDPQTANIICTIFIETTVGQKGVVSPMKTPKNGHFLASFLGTVFRLRNPRRSKGGPKNTVFPCSYSCLGGQKVGTVVSIKSAHSIFKVFRTFTPF